MTAAIPLSIIAAPVCDKTGKPRFGWFYVCTDLEDELFGSDLPESQDPLGDGARYFLQKGIPPETPIIFQRGPSNFMVMTSTLADAVRGAPFSGDNIVRFPSEAAARRGRR